MTWTLRFKVKPTLNLGPEGRLWKKTAWILELNGWKMWTLNSANRGSEFLDEWIFTQSGSSTIPSSYSWWVSKCIHYTTQTLCASCASVCQTSNTNMTQWSPLTLLLTLHFTAILWPLTSYWYFPRTYRERIGFLYVRLQSIFLLFNDNFFIHKQPYSLRTSLYFSS